jgi:hypothetical protein
MDVIAARRDCQARSNVVGRPRKVTPSIVESVVSLTLNDGSISCPRISQIVRRQTGVMLCPTSIRKTRRANKFSWGKAKKCPLLTPDHICASLQFAADFASERFQKLRGYPFVFTDESRFACGVTVAGSGVEQEIIGMLP